MNILITGASGFIGSHLLKRIEEKFQNNDVRLILLSSHEIPSYTCLLHNNYTYNVNDFKNKGINKIDAVIHLGGFVPRKKKERMSGYLNLSTIISTVYLLEHLPNVPNHFIYVSSSAVYGEDDGTLTYETEGHISDIDENTPPAPKSLYGVSKYLCEGIISEWGEKQGVIYQILRPTIIYGDEDYSSTIIPIMLKQAVVGNDLKLFAHPKMKRNYLYIDDCCDFILNALFLKEYAGPINLVSSQNVTMKQLVEMIIAISTKKINYKTVDDLSNCKGFDMGFNGQKRKKYLGNEKVSLDEGLLREYRYISSSNYK